ncbi:MAG TPA: M56 family metallopeptidase [Candidatus Didemnitutus sp.]
MIPETMMAAAIRHVAQGTVFAALVTIILASRLSWSPRLGRLLAGAALARFLVPLAVLGWEIPLGRASIPLARLLAGLGASRGAGRPSALEFTWETWAFLAWGAGAIACGTAMLGSGWVMRRRLRRVGQRPPADLVRRLAELARVAGVDPVWLGLVVTNSDTPVGVDGIFRSRINVPRELLQSLTAAEIDAVLLHELVHVRRRDNLWRLLPAVVTMLFWFHPLSWWLQRRFIVDGERACDETVVRLMHDRSAYASGLVKAARSALGLGVPGYSGMSAHGLNDRVAAIMQPQPQKDHPMYRLVITGILVSGFFLTASATGSPVDHADTYTIDQLNTPPRVLTLVSPEYPAELKESKVTGNVVLEYIIDVKGRVTETSVISSTNVHFSESAVAAVRQWTYAPGLHGGHPVNTRVRQNLVFNHP